MMRLVTWCMKCRRYGQRKAGETVDEVCRYCGGGPVKAEELQGSKRTIGKLFHLNVIQTRARKRAARRAARQAQDAAA